jgi:S-formylglutathione hydrolase
MNKNCVKMTVPLATALCVCCLLLTLPVLSQASDGLQELERSGELIAITVPAPSLQANAFAIPSEQPVSIYLPPSYRSSSERYPVVYFLPGFGDLVHYYTMWGVFGFSLKPAMDELISTGKVREMIVVIPNGSYFLQGSFYVNSPLSGNWEDYITKDVVSYVDTNYRTIASSASRGLSGHSMGGFGALFIAMRHPDVFGAVYALSPGLAEPNGLMQHDMFVNEGAFRRTLALMDTLSRLSENEAKVVLMSSANSLLNSADLPGVFAIAYGMAFAPRKDGKPPFFEYPYSMVDGKPVLNSEVWARWETGFGDLADKVAEYKTNLLKLRALVVDIGIHDEHVWIPPGCRAFA